MMWHNESLNESDHSSHHRHELPYGHVMPYTFYLWYLQPPLGLVILFVNSLTITAVCRFSFLHSASNILIANLAFADLLLAVLAMPINCRSTACSLGHANKLDVYVFWNRGPQLLHTDPFVIATVGELPLFLGRYCYRTFPVHHQAFFLPEARHHQKRDFRLHQYLGS